MNKLVIIAGCLYLSVLTGCAALIGIKSYQGSDGSRIEFITGYDIAASANGIDTVNNTRGIEPDSRGARK